MEADCILGVTVNEIGCQLQPSALHDLAGEQAPSNRGKCLAPVLGWAQTTFASLIDDG